MLLGGIGVSNRSHAKHSSFATVAGRKNLFGQVGGNVPVLLRELWDWARQRFFCLKMFEAPRPKKFELFLVPPSM